MLDKETFVRYTLIEQMFKGVKTMKKTYRIKNKFRFTLFVAVMVVVFSVLIGAIAPVKVHADSSIRYVEVKVCGGDTLWSLASEYGDQNKDIRENIYDICRINGISAETLREGDTIIIPR